MKTNKPLAACHQTGFSLIEVLVGLVIGLLATLVIMQVFSVFEGQKRTTTGVADAQTNGSIALYTIARELQMAGYGLLPVTDSAIKCVAPTIAAVATAAGVASISPVTITDGGDAGASDSITIRYADSPTAGTPVPITLVAGLAASIPNNLGCAIGNIALILTGPTTCNVTTVTGLTDTTGVTLGDATGAIAGAQLACLGRWNEITYRITNNNLERNAPVATPIVSEIVNIQAQYGISDAANSNQVVQWVNAAGATWAAPTTPDRNRIKAVRIAVVARTGLIEKEGVTQTCNSLTANNPSGLCAWSGTSASPLNASPAPAINLTNLPNWQRYRYRVFETIIPLRNVIWSRSTL